MKKTIDTELKLHPEVIDCAALEQPKTPEEVQDECIASIALTFVMKVRYMAIKQYIEACGSARALLANPKMLKERIPDVSVKHLALFDKTKEAYDKALEEWAYIQEKGLQCICYCDSRYPSRLRECIDAPAVIYSHGDVDLNTTKVLAVVGTRHISAYGKQVVHACIKDLARLCPDTLVVSGLAYGVDIHTHRACLEYGLKTVAVLAHGLDRIYPAVHRKTAADMVSKGGGLMTDYPIHTTPDKHHFIARNRIVAGMADATLVIESAIQGGSLITADLAESYNRPVFAVPGKITDEFSAGCNELIRANRAYCTPNIEYVVEQLNWDYQSPSVIEPQLFPDLSEEEETVCTLLREEGGLSLDELALSLHVPANVLIGVLMNLEIKGLIMNLAGNRYQLR